MNLIFQMKNSKSRGGFRGGHGHYNHGGPPGGRNSVFIPFQAFDIEHCEVSPLIHLFTNSCNTVVQSIHFKLTC